MKLKEGLQRRNLWRSAQGGTTRENFELLALDIAVLNSDAQVRTFWRGQRSARHLLWPSAFREERWPTIQTQVDDCVDKKTGELLAHFNAARPYWAVGYPPRSADRDLEMLAVMQHQGVDTHLLDLTSDPFAALWFACHDFRHEGRALRDSGVLLAFNFPRDREPGSELLTNATRTFGWFRPPAIDSRIVAQRSVFLQSRLLANCNRWPTDVGRICLPEMPPLWSELSLDSLFVQRDAGRPELLPPLIGFEVPAGGKDQFRSILDRNFGLTDASLFPDLGGAQSLLAS